MLITNEGHRACFELEALKTKIEDVSSGLYCCYGNLLYKKDDHNLFTGDRAFM